MCPLDWKQDLDSTRRNHLRVGSLLWTIRPGLSLYRAGLMKPFEGRKTFVPIVYPPGPGAGAAEMVIQPAERSAMDPLCLQQNGRILGESNIIFAFPSVKVRQISNIRGTDPEDCSNYLHFPNVSVAAT